MKPQMIGFVVLQDVSPVKPSVLASFLLPSFMSDTPNTLIMRQAFRSVIQGSSQFGSRFLPALVLTAPVVG